LGGANHRIKEDDCWEKEKEIYKHQDVSYRERPSRQTMDFAGEAEQVTVHLKNTRRMSKQQAKDGG